MTDPRPICIVIDILRTKLRVPLAHFTDGQLAEVASDILSALAESGADGRVERALGFLRSEPTRLTEALMQRAAALEALSAPNPSNSSNSSPSASFPALPTDATDERVVDELMAKVATGREETRMRTAEKVDCPSCNAAKVRIEQLGYECGHCAICGKRHERMREEPMPDFIRPAAQAAIEKQIADSLPTEEEFRRMKEHPDTIALRELREAIDKAFPRIQFGLWDDRAERLRHVRQWFDGWKQQAEKSRGQPSPPEPPRPTTRSLQGARLSCRRPKGNPNGDIEIGTVLAVCEGGLLVVRFMRDASYVKPGYPVDEIVTAAGCYFESWGDERFGRREP